MPPSTPSDTDASAGTDTGTSDEQRRFSRRQVLAAAGASGVLGGVFGAVVGSRLDGPVFGAAEKCDSDPLSTARHPWPHPEADAARTGHVSERQAPTTLDGGWTADHGFQRTGTPLVADEAVLLPTEWDADRGGRFVAVDPEDGTEHWRTGYRPFRPGTATIAGDSLYMVWEDGLGALALADGTERWHASHRPERESRPIVPGLVVTGGQVVTCVPDDGGTRFETFHGRTGRRCGATTATYGPLNRGPVVSGTQAFFAPGWSSLYAFSLRDWSLDWKRHFDAIGVNVPRVDDGTVYVGGDGLLTALDPADGSTLWSRESSARTEGDPASVPTHSIVAVTPERLLTRGPDPDDETTSSDGITAFARADGSTLWHRSPDRDDTYRYSVLAAAGDALYVAFYDSGVNEYRLLELATATGEVRDSATLNEMPSDIAVGHGRVFVAGVTGIQALGG